MFGGLDGVFGGLDYVFGGLDCVFGGLDGVFGWLDGVFGGLDGVFGGLHYDEIFVTSGGMNFDGNFEINFGQAVYESCKATIIVAISSALSLSQRKATETFVVLAGCRAFRLHIDFYTTLWVLNARKLCAQFSL